MTEQHIEVLAAFREGEVIPKVFKWGAKKYVVERLNLSYVIKKGATRLIVFKVSDNANDWTLVFDTRTLAWRLEEEY